MNPKKLYKVVLTAIFAGYLWLGYLIISDQTGQPGKESKLNTCVFSNLTGLPCPSCGMSRSVISIIQARLADALWWNPLGFIMAAAMAVFPVWVLTDLFTNKQTFYLFYLKTEQVFKNKKISALAIALMLALWVWNIIKFS